MDPESTLFYKKVITQLRKTIINIYAAEGSVTNLCRMRSSLYMGMVYSYTLIQQFSGVLLPGREAQSVMCLATEFLSRRQKWSLADKELNTMYNLEIRM